jgi:threonine/homoserine/homoserine lactone efflux protein
MYVLSRAVVQGRRAGLVCLAGVMLGYLFYMLAAALASPPSLRAFRMRLPCWRWPAHFTRWMAWQSLRPGGRSPFELASGHALQPGACC